MKILGKILIYFSYFALGIQILFYIIHLKSILNENIHLNWIDEIQYIGLSLMAPIIFFIIGHIINKSKT